MTKGRQPDRNLIHKRIDGELNKTETKNFRKQIKTDPNIKREYERLKRVAEASEKIVKPLPPPPDFTRRVLKNLKEIE